MKKLLLLPLVLLVAGCGRSYNLIGRVVFMESPASTITEVVGNRIPAFGTPIEGAEITLFHELKNGLPVRDEHWNTTVKSDRDGAFHLFDYATPGEVNIAGLEIRAAGFETAYTVYKDYIDPDEQYFWVVLKRQSN